ncbi:hypothetical protein XENTR_v10011922 [Xenopus tropicalis]|nr:hypothetical protein XENTR_v10011922 [Xenopus tropicalis]
MDWNAHLLVWLLFLTDIPVTAQLTLGSSRNGSTIQTSPIVLTIDLATIKQLMERTKYTSAVIASSVIYSTDSAGRERTVDLSHVTLESSIETSLDTEFPEPTLIQHFASQSSFPATTNGFSHSGSESQSLLKSSSFTTMSPVLQSSVQPASFCFGNSNYLIFKILNLNYSESLSDHSSSEFQELKMYIKNLTEQKFRMVYSGAIVEVIQFKQGSVIVEMLITFTIHTNTHLREDFIKFLIDTFKNGQFK